MSFIKSPAITGQMKVPENLSDILGTQNKNQQKNDSKNLKQGNNILQNNPFGRERLNSAFKKYDSDDKNKPGLPDDGEIMRSPLTRG